MSVATLENDRLRVAVATHFGGRVTELLDKRSGRDWLAKGGEAADTSEGAVYLADACVGWDECFPTVSPWDAAGTPWRRRLRDHGDLWGRPVEVVAQSAAALAVRYSGREFTLTRRLTLDGASLVADYTVENTTSEPLPYLWALHALYAAKPGERLVLPGISSVAATYLSRDSRVIARDVLPWPAGDAAIGFPLDVVQPDSVAFAGKLYATAFSAPWAALGSEAGWLEVNWNAGEIAHSGLWLNYGGWPQVPGLHHVALEATSASADHLGQAIERGEAPPLAPGEQRRWQVTHSLTDTVRKAP